MELDSFGALGAHFARLAAGGEAVTHHIAAEGAKVIQEDAKSRFGSYQDGGGGFPAWANLAPATVDDRIRRGFTPDDPLLRTGGLRDSIVTKAEGAVAVVASTDPVMLYQEQGTATIPPRPVLGPAGLNSEKTVGRVAARTLVAWISGIGWRRPRITLEDL
ncbi:hypothetical protein J7E70_02260 [Variovorax paradoxus]|nr:hypothetical protein [Variovorax paradoxus]MBT2299277.1 hypothetical protein [Variovorax paradoxus]